MGKIDISVLNDLTAFDSATVQNAAIRIRGYVPEDQDYSGTSIRRYTGDVATVVWIATTIKAKALNEPRKIIGIRSSTTISPLVLIFSV